MNMRFSIALPWIALAGVVTYVGYNEHWPEGFNLQPSHRLALPHEFNNSSASTAVSGPISYAPAVSRAAPAVVNIYSTQRLHERSNPRLEYWFQFPGQQPPHERQANSLGSGVIVSSEGYILTNDHVVAGADKIIVALNDGREVAAKVIGSDPDTDLAVVRINLDKLPVLPFKTSPSAVGDVVLAIGNPFGVGQTVTQGIVSALGRRGLGINTYEDFIQTDAAINPGNSGGALIDVNGNLLGINTAIYSRSGGSMGIGFAIPAPLAKQVMSDIISQGHVVRAWLGVEIASQTASDSLPSARNKSDVFIAAVMPAGPGAKGGLKAGDQLINVAGVEVTSPDQVIRQIGGFKPNAKAAIIITRDGKHMTLSITMGERPKQRSVNEQAE